MDERRRVIEERREAIRGRLADVERRLVEVRTARNDWTDEEHDPEGFALTFEWQQAEGSRTQYESDLRDLDQAEIRIENGTYGMCYVCGGLIPTAQLELRPARTTCVACT
jgi:DnaK suppressor protein